MKYNFDELVDRYNTNCVKWDFKEEALKCEKDVIPMWIADMDFKTVPEITEAIIERAKHEIYGYSDKSDSFYNEIINWMSKRHNFNIKKEWICTTPGVVPALNFIVKAFANKGDKVIVQSPVYYPFYAAIENQGCEIVKNSLKFEQGKYSMDFEDLEAKVKDPKVKIMILCNPHNPVGKVWTKEELTKLGGICLDNNVLVVSDEIHSDLVYKEYKHTSFGTVCNRFRENSIICTAPSKTFNIAGVQVSNIIISNKDLRDKFEAVQFKLGLKSLNVFAITACEAAYKHGEQWLEELIEYLHGNKEFLKNFIKERIPEINVIEPEGTYLMWLDCRKLNMNAEELKNFMLTKAKVAFDEGDIFGKEGEGFERINIACPKSILEEALIRMEEAIKSR